jgi:FAD dependent oxidoreductase TIGR03364
MDPEPRTSLSGSRIVVVGAGILGTMHAYAALQRGAQVVHLERDEVPRGATVRNFGLIWVSGRARGRELALALRARELWRGIAEVVPGVGFRANGSLTLAVRPDEMEVIEKAVAMSDASERRFEIVDVGEIRFRNPSLLGNFLGGLFCALDAAVESRQALDALRQAMTATGNYEFLANREIAALNDYEVVDHLGTRHRGDELFLCVGATLSGFASELFQGEPLRSVRLQMAETAPMAASVTTSIANGDSFRYYPAFRDFVGALAPQHPDDARYAMQLLCQQRLHGGLTLGDTHEEDASYRFETFDEPLNRISVLASSLLGAHMPAIARRWSGTYHQLTDPKFDEVYYRKVLAKGVTAITGAGGRGMTLAPAIAEESFQ